MEPIASTFEQGRNLLLDLVKYLFSRPLGLPPAILRVEADLVYFISFYTLRDKPLSTKDGELEFDAEESEEDFQTRVEYAVTVMRAWDCVAAGNNYVKIAEAVVQDCRFIPQLSSC